ncbi:methyltransferase family protein [Sphingomonas lenta]|uniref:Protein-S-isoprenylcysteine methyltransferase n=1 Tax=Sphingomonas lenta TaxID=1141887 RepID=A0A2A2SDF4_9SPHN|nr:isoprenylcysteine carboxylmethyltransferase family protein [Sphingomonas lenta]PAX07286.1 protein-S-isoprenylcysteine methyltransferase [Sphingomonas lenta]
MFHDRRLRLRTDPRPRSAVTHGVGLAGLAGVAAWIAVAKLYGLDGPYSALVNLLACAVPMVLWSLLVDKVHRNPSTGVDWSSARPLRETLDGSLTKLAGLWAIWGLIAVVYATGRFYWQGGFQFAMWCFTQAAPVLFVLSIPYVLWIDRRLVEPRDGAYHLGAWMTGQPYDRELIFGHLRSWAVKAFFLAFMLAITPPGFGDLIRAGWRDALASPVALAGLLMTLMFVVDVAFASVGYILTMRPLDSHIRSANPYAAGWTAALICYPPFQLMSPGGPLDYHPGTSDWVRWFADWPVLQAVVGAILVALTAVYAWATVAFGLRFSNLTHRGVLTHGPYAWTRHPAYLSKNLFWWLSTLPFLSTASLVDAARATILLGVVSGVYYWRAKTEERHLREDPAYQAYDAWMARNGPVPRLFARLRGQ